MVHVPHEAWVSPIRSIDLINLLSRLLKSVMKPRLFPVVMGWNFGVNYNPLVT